MNGPQSVMAFFSNLVYSVNDDEESKVRTNLLDQKDEHSSEYPSLSINNYSLFNLDKDAFSYINNEDKIVIVAYRGSEDWKDFWTDVTLALGLPVKRIEAARRFFDDSVAKLTDSDHYVYYITGHSLGGFFAEKVTCNVNFYRPELKVVCASFNAGSSFLARNTGIPQELIDSDNLTQDNISSIKIDGDLVSNTILHGHGITLEKTPDDDSECPIALFIYAHHMSNFLYYAGKRERLLNAIAKNADLTPYIKLGFKIDEITQEYMALKAKTQ